MSRHYLSEHNKNGERTSETSDHRLSADNIDAERKRHDAEIEKLQAAQIEWAHQWQQRIDFINNQLRLERKAETKFTDLNDAMREYHEVFGHELPSLP